jgi:hypothetical protein
MAELFSDGTRTDWSPGRQNEGTYAFLERSATPTFAEVRRLLEEWLSHVPSSERPQLIGNMRLGDNHAFEAAFWELYLHEAYVRSGYRVTIHPAVSGNGKRPDFLIESADARFYLEAVRVNDTPAKAGEDRRLSEVHATLDQLTAERFTVRMTVFAVGSMPPPARRLRNSLVAWLRGLDPEVTAAEFDRHKTLPSFFWDHQDWSLEFEALPMKPMPPGATRRFVSVYGAGEARAIDNISGIGKVLDYKANRYGRLDAPLVIAVMCNTEYPTYDYEVEQALFGISSRRPSDPSPTYLFREGHWLSRQGWRRGHAPQVIAVQNLKPWFVTHVHPRVWGTLQPGVELPAQPSWLARVDVSAPHATATETVVLADHFGLPANWLHGPPEFRM